MTRQLLALNPGPNTEAFGIHGTDLLIPVATPDGQRILWFGGDSFTRRFLDPSAGWFSPIMFVSNIGDPYRFISCNKQVLRYEHHKNGVSTKLPTSAIFIGSRLYLHYMIMGLGGLMDTVGTGMAYSDDEGRTWTDVGLLWRGDSYGGVNQMRAMIDGRDGWIYHFTARGLARDSNVIMLRCRPEHMLDPSKYEAWGLNGPNRTWAFGRDPWAILPNGVQVMELSVAWVENKLVFSYARKSAPSGVEVKIGDGIFTNWVTAPTWVAVRNGWDGPASLNQLYGGYVIPGSTLRDLRLAVSQWNTRTNDPYRVVVFDQTDLTRAPIVNPFAQAIENFLSRFRR